MKLERTQRIPDTVFCLIVPNSLYECQESTSRFKNKIAYFMLWAIKTAWIYLNKMWSEYMMKYIIKKPFSRLIQGALYTKMKKYFMLIEHYHVNA